MIGLALPIPALSLKKVMPLRAISFLLVLLCWRSVAGIHAPERSKTSHPDDETEQAAHGNDEGRMGGNHHDDGGSNFFVGTGIYDMTGPAAQINFMGYAKSSQAAHGIHLRLRSRAFIVSELPPSTSLKRNHNLDENSHDVAIESSNENDSLSQETRTKNSGIAQRQDDESQQQQRNRREEGFLRWTRNNVLFGSKAEEEDTSSPTPSSLVSQLDPDRTICFVSMDVGMGSDLLNRRVLERLDELLPEQQQQQEQQHHHHPQHGNDRNSNDSAIPRKRLCHLENLSISGTHTHSAPAGFIQYALYQITSKGFSDEVFDTYVESVAQSILRAYINLERGSIEVATDMLWDANINRSPTSYLLNPQWERDLYHQEGDTDKAMVQLKFSKTQGDASTESNTPVGILNWFSVHGTSMNSSNMLISGDNKGYASYLMEKHVNGNETLPGQGDFVAAFASTNLGDVSPNTSGPRCLDTGMPCDAKSTCNGSSHLCIAFGPGKDMQESTEIIGRKQFEMALRLLDTSQSKTNNSTYLEGRVDFRHSFVDMSNVTVTLENGGTARTCPAALGYAFAAGTTDGPGMFDFTQGQNSSNSFWNLIGSFLSPPSEEQKKCHHPKPILLNTGMATLPYLWDPEVVPISVFRVGNLFILSLPCELTTMAGRRLRRAIQKIVQERGGISNPDIVIAGLANSYTHYVTTFEEYGGQRYEAASTLYGPHTLSAYIQELERLTNDMFDGRPSSTSEAPRDLGRDQFSLIEPVVVDAIGIGRKFGSVAIDAKDRYSHGDTVHVSFRSANPRNNQRIEDSFLKVDLRSQDGSWNTLYVDGDWSTKYVWKSDVEALRVSFAEIYWTIPNDTENGTYRICHYGTRKTWIADLEWLAFHASDWWPIDMFGSMAVGVFAQGVQFLASISDSFDLVLREWTIGRYKDFQGCSRSFTVSSL